MRLRSDRGLAVFEERREIDLVVVAVEAGVFGLQNLGGEPPERELVSVEQPRRADHAYRIAAALRFDFAEPVRDVIQRLIPGGRDQMFAATNHRARDSLVAVNEINRVAPERAEKLVIDSAAVRPRPSRATERISFSLRVPARIEHPSEQKLQTVGVCFKSQGARCICKACAAKSRSDKRRRSCRSRSIRPSR